MGIGEGPHPRRVHGRIRACRPSGIGPKACVEKLKIDEAFRARVMAVDDVEARMALIVAEGFDCSAEEIGSLQELVDADLSGVDGGGGGGVDCHCLAGWCLGGPGTPGWDAGRG